MTSHTDGDRAEAPSLRYDCCPERLGLLAAWFRPLAPDATTRAWLDEHGQRPLGSLTTALLEVLYRFMSVYDAHGLLGSYPMHLFSTEQLRELAGDGHSRLLDVGAGAGYVTQYAAPLAEHIVCTETSDRLARRLRKRGFDVHALDVGETPLPHAWAFDVILCLNVLDRTSHPLRLLRALRALCAAETRVVLALPVPVRPAVFVPGGSVDPVEALPSAATDFEASVVAITERTLQPAGFRVERIARAPYLSRGDLHQPLYVLDDAVWVLRADR